MKIFLCGTVHSDWRMHLKNLMNKRTDITFVDPYKENWVPTDIFEELINISSCDIVIVYKPSKFNEYQVKFFNAYNVKYIKFESLKDIITFVDSLNIDTFKKDIDNYIENVRISILPKYNYDYSEYDDIMTEEEKKKNSRRK